MREEYEAWFTEKFGHPPMPLVSRQIDFCWHGYQAGVEAMRQQLAAKQAEVDALMLEYCPNEMTKEQLDNWAAHQCVAKGAREMIGFRCECGPASTCTYPKCNAGAEVSSKDITERLRDYARDYTTTTYHDDLISDAATEIESLRQQVTLYEQALLASWPKGAIGDAFDFWDAARSTRRHEGAMK